MSAPNPQVVEMLFCSLAITEAELGVVAAEYAARKADFVKQLHRTNEVREAASLYGCWPLRLLPAGAGTEEGEGQ